MSLAYLKNVDTKNLCYVKSNYDYKIINSETLILVYEAWK